MTSSFADIEHNGFVSSPSSSPNHTIFSQGFSFDSNSDCSTPNSPRTRHISSNSFVPYNVFEHSATPASFHPAHHTGLKIPIKLVSSTLEDGDRRRKKSSASNNSDKELPTMHLRRRAQNRASQRAFRERKEKHVKGLEHQLEELHEKHQDLLQSYSKQVDEVSRLKMRVTQLSTELHTIQHFQATAMDDLMLPDKFDRFDAFSSTDMIYNASDGFYDRVEGDSRPDFISHPFEDSL